MVDHDPKTRRESRRFRSPVADDRGRRDDERRTGTGGAGEVGEHRGRLAQPHVEGEAPAEIHGVEEPQPAQGLGLIRAQPSDEAVGLDDGFARDRPRLVEQVRGPAFALDEQAVAQRAMPSRPTACRRISAPVSCVVVARSASAAAASFRSTLSSSTQRPCDCTSGRASAARRATSSAVSSTSSNTADHCTLLSWRAPTIVSPEGSTNRRNPGFGLRRDSDGTRTSKPAASNDSPVRVMRSHASSVLRYTCPRRSAPARCNSGRSRSRRASSSATGRVDFVADSATSTSTRARSGPGPSTDRNHAPLRVGRVELHDEPRPRELVADFDHRCSRSATSESGA